MGNDLCHPGIGIDLANPASCYIGSVYDAGRQPIASASDGPWSPVGTFVVKRDTTPGNGRTLSDMPETFEWTRTQGATLYRVSLSRYNQAEQQYELLAEDMVQQSLPGAVKGTVN